MKIPPVAFAIPAILILIGVLMLVGVLVIPMLALEPVRSGTILKRFDYRTEECVATRVQSTLVLTWAPIYDQNQWIEKKVYFSFDTSEFSKVDEASFIFRYSTYAAYLAYKNGGDWAFDIYLTDFGETLTAEDWDSPLLEHVRRVRIGELVRTLEPMDEELVIQLDPGWIKTRGITQFLYQDSESGKKPPYVQGYFHEFILKSPRLEVVGENLEAKPIEENIDAEPPPIEPPDEIREGPIEEAPGAEKQEPAVAYGFILAGVVLTVGMTAIRR